MANLPAGVSQYLLDPNYEPGPAGALEQGGFHAPPVTQLYRGGMLAQPTTQLQTGWLDAMPESPMQGDWSAPGGEYKPNLLYPAIELNEGGMQARPEFKMASNMPGPVPAPMSQFSAPPLPQMDAPAPPSPDVMQDPTYQAPGPAPAPQGNPGFEIGNLRMPGAAPQSSSQSPILGNSDAGMWGLIAAGLGILANTQGSYGSAAGPIGKGGLMGVQTYLQQREQNVQNLAQQQRLNIAQREQAAREAEYTSQAGLRNEQVSKMKFEMQTQQQYQQAYHDFLASLPPGTDIGKVMRNPDTQFTLAGKLGAVNPAAAALAQKAGLDLLKEQKQKFTKIETDVGGNKTKSQLLEEGSGMVQDVPGTMPNDKFNPNPLVTNQTNVNAYTPASQQAQIKFIEQASANYANLKTAPALVDNIDKAKALVPKSGTFVGSFGETKRDIAQFFNNNLGTNIAPDEIASAGELQTRLFTQIMENLKKMDAQPSQEQQRIMMASLGNLNTDPKALPRILDVMRDIVIQKVDIHNTEMRGALKNGVVFPFDPIIDMGARGKTGGRTVKRTGEYQGKRIIQYTDGSASYEDGTPVDIK